MLSTAVPDSKVRTRVASAPEPGGLPTGISDAKMEQQPRVAERAITAEHRQAVPLRAANGAEQRGHPGGRRHGQAMEERRLSLHT